MGCCFTMALVFITIKELNNFIYIRVMLSDNLKEETESTERGWKKYKKEIADYIPCTYKEDSYWNWA